MEKKLMVICSTILTLCFFFGNVPSVNAQDEFTLEEITVTAEKRETDLQDTSMSISAVTGTEIREQSMLTITEILRDMPSVVMSYNGFGGIFVNIRGMGADLPGGEGSVALNFDGTYNSSTDAGIFGYFDLDRVETLRGPQGTLYGRNATGGVVNILTAIPNTEKIEGYGLVEYGNYSLLREEGAINVPIDDKTAARVAVSNIDQKGYMSDGSGAVSGTALRAKYGYYPSDDVSAILQVTSSKMRGVSPSSIVTLADWAAGDYYISVEHAPWEKYNKRSYKINADITITAGPGIINFVPSYELSKDRNWTYDDTTDSMSQGNSDVTQHAGELRYSSFGDARIQWVTGLYYYNRNSESGPTSRNPLPTSSGAVSKAGFAQITYPLTDIYRLIAGGRWSDETVENDNPNSGLIGEKGYGGMDWKVGLEADLAKDVMSYFTIATGRRPGGFNQAAEYDEETLMSAEFGVKSRFMENRAQLNGDIFYYDYNDYQIVDGYLEDGQVVMEFYNVPQVKNYGAELEGDLLVGEATVVNGSLSYLHPRYESHFTMHTNPLLPGEDMIGKVLPHSPEWTIKGGIEHTFTFSGGSTLKPSIDARWTDEQYIAPVPSETQFQKAYTIVDANMRYGSASGYWSLNFYVKNAFDEVYKQGGAAQNIVVGVPRKYGATFQVTF